MRAFKFVRYRRSIVVWLVLGRGITDVADVSIGIVLDVALSNGDPGGGEDVAEDAILAVVDLDGTRLTLVLGFV